MVAKQTYGDSKQSVANDLTEHQFCIAMEIRPDCVPCLMKRVLFQARLASNGTEYAALSAALKAYADGFSEGRNSAEVATEVHRDAYGAMGVEDPYRDLKVRADRIAGAYIGPAEEYVWRSDDRLRAALKVAAIGNIMDFGSGIAIDAPEEFEPVFEDMLAQDALIDDGIEATLNAAGRILYIFDNCGETQMDKVLLRELRSMGKTVVGVVRGENILNDVTLEDARRSGLCGEVDSMITTGMFAIGVDISRAGSELKDEIKKADLIMAKGMANYESLSSEKLGRPVVYVMRTKCAPVSESVGRPLESNVVRLVEQ